MFGVGLEILLQREAGGGPVPPGTVPIIIDQCLSEVESRGLTEVGICTWPFSSHCVVFAANALADRIAGAVSEINALKDAYNRGRWSELYSRHFIQWGAGRRVPDLQYNRYPCRLRPCQDLVQSTARTGIPSIILS